MTAAEETVVAAAAAGRLANLDASADDRGGDDAAEPEVRPAAKLTPIRAEVLEALCTRPEAEVRARGVRVAHARVEGVLDLQNAELRVPLSFEKCRFAERVVLVEAHAPAVTFEGCLLARGVAAARLRTDGSLTFARSVVDGPIDVYDATVGGDLDCQDLRMTAVAGQGADAVSDDVGFSAMGIDVGADVALQGCTVVDGGVSLYEAKVGRAVYADGAELHNAGGAALELDGCEIRGKLSLIPGPAPCLGDAPGDVRRFVAHGTVSLSRTHAALVDCRGAQLDGGALAGAAEGDDDHERGTALDLWGADVERDVWMSPWVPPEEDAGAPVRTEIRGLLQMIAASVGGDVVAPGVAVVAGIFDASRMKVGGVVYLNVAADDQGRALRDGQGELLRFGAPAVWLSASRLGELDAAGARLTGKDGLALSLTDAVVAGAVTLDAWCGRDVSGAAVRAYAELAGLVNLHSAHVGELSAQGTTITAAGGVALSLWAARVDRDTNLSVTVDDGVPLRSELSGQLVLTRAVLGGDLILRGSRLRGDLNGGSAQVAGRLLVDTLPLDASGTAGPAQHLRTTVEGTMDLTGSRLGPMYLSGAKLAAKRDRVALDLSTACISGELSLEPFVSGAEVLRCEVTGAVRLSAAQLEGDLRASGARIRGIGDALVADHATVTGDVQLDRSVSEGVVLEDAHGAPVRFDAEGETTFFNATIKGQLVCRGGRFSNPRGSALTLYGIDVVGDALLDEVTEAVTTLPSGPPLTFEAEGRVRLFTAHIGNNLSLRGARISNHREPSGASDVDSWTALDAASLTVVNWLALDRLQSTGAVNIASGRFGTLYCKGARVEAGSVPAGTPVFDAHHVKVAGELTWREVVCQGVVSFQHASVGSLDDDLESWPERRTEVVGFTYGDLVADQGWRERTGWLERQPTPLAQPYHQLAALYRARGDDHAARKVNMERFNVRLRQSPPVGRRGARVWRWILRCSIGHGYEPWRALPLLLLVVVVVWAMTTLEARQGDMVPTRPGVSPEQTATDCSRRDYPCLQPLLYATDVVVPVLDFGQRAAWRPAGGLGHRVVMPLGTFLGYFLTALVIAGFTGVVRRE